MFCTKKDSAEPPRSDFLSCLSVPSQLSTSRAGHLALDKTCCSGFVFNEFGGAVGVGYFPVLRNSGNSSPGERTFVWKEKKPAISLCSFSNYLGSECAAQPSVCWGWPSGTMGSLRKHLAVKTNPLPLQNLQTLFSAASVSSVLAFQCLPTVPPDHLFLPVPCFWTRSPYQFIQAGSA